MSGKHMLISPTSARVLNDFLSAARNDGYAYQRRN